MNADATKVVIVGGGFAGVACAKRLAEEPGVGVQLIDRAGYHQFQPLLYQVATAELTFEDIRFDLARIFHGKDAVHVRKTVATGIDPDAMAVTLEDGHTLAADYVVLAGGARPNFFRTPGADKHAFPLYSVEDARHVRGRIVQVFEDARERPELIDEGALTFVVVGGGPTGVETAGALSELVHNVMPHIYKDPPPDAAQVILVDLGHSLLSGGFSVEAGTYAARQLQKRGVKLRLGVPVKEVTADHVALADGTQIKTRLVVWGGGEQAAEIAGAAGISQGRAGRIDVRPDLSVPGHPKIFAVGDIANIPSGDEVLPQLGSVAQQAGRWAGDNIVALRRGEPATPFHYRDKGIMAMIGRKAAVAEMGAHRHEIHGRLAFAAWLGVHAELLGNIGAELKAFVAWAEEFYVRPHHRSAALLEPSRIDMPRIDWEQKG